MVPNFQLCANIEHLSLALNRPLDHVGKPVAFPMNSSALTSGRAALKSRSTKSGGWRGKRRPRRKHGQKWIGAKFALAIGIAAIPVADGPLLLLLTRIRIWDLNKCGKGAAAQH
jgi:hypothetical protein